MKPTWSEPHEIVNVFDVNFEVKDLSTGLISRIHFDRLSRVIPKLRKEPMNKDKSDSFTPLSMGAASQENEETLREEESSDLEFDLDSQ